MAALAIQIGQKASRQLTFTRAEVEAYARITGDYNPLHFDESFAAATKFARYASKPVTQLRASVRRAEGEVVLEGVCWCYTLLRESAR